MHVRLCVLPGGGDPHLEAVSLCTAIQPAGVVSARVGLLIFCSCRCSEASCSCWWRPVRRSCPRRPCRAGGSWRVAFGAAGAAPAARGGRPTLLDENRLRGRIGPRAGNALQRCFMRERGAFPIPFCPPLWKTPKDDGCTCSGSARVPGRPGARDRYGHALTGWEAASRRYAATAGSTWRRRAAEAGVGFRAPRNAGWT